MDKAPDAFRTISEVAEALETPAHVLRFWETRFPQIKPVKRAGGRRYYRPNDVALLTGIRKLLHSEGMTIRGVQKILREQGVRHVAALGGGDPAALEPEVEDIAPAPLPDPPEAEIVPIAPHLRREAETPAEPPAEAGYVPPPRVDEAGFIAFAPPRTPRPRPRAVETDPNQPRLPLSEPEEVPEAPHVWVDTPEADTAPVTLYPAATPGPDKADEMQEAEVEIVPDLAGLATRLRALGPVSPGRRMALAELHSRLGLLQAQMAEALRLRR